MTKRLNFGCGKKILKGFYNVDVQKGNGIDKSFDFNKFPYPLSDNTFDYVLVDNVFEHLDEPKKVLDELRRICKPNAVIKIIVPHYHCAGAYNDIEHKHFFNETAIKQLVEGEDYSLNEKQKFKIISLKSIPTKFGKLFIFEKIRKIMSLILGEIYAVIETEIKIYK